MRIALFGYGKMGKTIEKLALQHGHSIVLKINDAKDPVDFSQVDVAIDFSTPEAAYANIIKALDNKIPIVCGTTGWLHRYDEVVRYCKEKQGSFIYASNFSLGVNLFFELNRYLAQLLQSYDYEPQIVETHHIQKLDAPSGTAITLANQILPFKEKRKWALDTNKPDELNIIAKRIDKVPGTHQVCYDSDVDQIAITHTAKNRDGFALGALIAATFIINKKGIFTMKDVLKKAT